MVDNCHSKINILYIIDQLNLGGTEKQLFFLINSLDITKFRPHICILKPSVHTFEMKTDIPVLELNYKSFLRPGLIKCIYSLSTFIRKKNIHIVQCFFQDSTLLAAMSRPFHKARLVGSFRDMGFWRTPLETFKMRVAYRSFDAFIANSEAVKNHFVQTDEIPEKTIMVIYNGVPADLSDLPSTKFSEEIKIGIVGNCNRPVKRMQDFIHAAAMVHRQRPHTSFYVVGDGYLRPELEKLSRDSGIGNVIKFTGIVSEPLTLIRDFHIGINTSETEGFSNAVLEYMVCGLPVVVSDVGGNSELIDDGVNGFLYPVGDISSLVDKIIKLVDDEKLRKIVAIKNLNKVKENFTMPIMVKRHESFYRKLVNC